LDTVIFVSQSNWLLEVCSLKAASDTENWHVLPNQLWHGCGGKQRTAQW